MCRTSWCRRCSRRRSSAANSADVYPITGTGVPKYRAFAAGRDLSLTFASLGHPGCRRGGGSLSGLGIPPPFRAGAPLIAACCSGHLRPYLHSNGDRTFASRWLGGWGNSLREARYGTDFSSSSSRTRTRFVRGRKPAYHTHSFAAIGTATSCAAPPLGKGRTRRANRWQGSERLL
jgi:hypothetical protein